MSSLNRIFVGGLRDSTHRSEIEAYFKQFGRIKKVFMPTVRLDKKKGPPEAAPGLSPAKYSVLGYVFIKFYKSSAAEKCLEAGPHEVAGKKVDVERAFIIEGSVNEALSKLQLKLFFRGFPADTPRSRPVSLGELLGLLSAFGEVRSLRVVDKNGKPIGFVVYKDQDPVRKILQRSKVPFITALGDLHMVDSTQQLEFELANGPKSGDLIAQFEAAGSCPDSGNSKPSAPKLAKALNRPTPANPTGDAQRLDSLVGPFEPQPLPSLGSDALGFEEISGPMAPQNFHIGGSESISQKKSHDSPQQAFLFQSNSGSGFRSEPIRASSKLRSSPQKRGLDDHHEEQEESEHEAEHANLGLFEDHAGENSLDSSHDESEELSDPQPHRGARRPAEGSAEARSDSDPSRAPSRSTKGHRQGEAPTGFPSLPIAKSRSWLILDPVTYQEQSVFEAIRLLSKRAEESVPVVRFNRAADRPGRLGQVVLRSAPFFFNCRARYPEPVNP